MKKRNMRVGLATVMCVLLVAAGCGQQAQEQSASEEVSVLTPEEILPAPEQVELEEPDYAFFTVPEMDVQLQEYYEDYVKPLLYNGLLMTEWSCDEYGNLMPDDEMGTPGSYLIMAFEDLAGEDAMQALWSTYDIDLPAEEVESLLLSRFCFEREQIREILSHFYREEKGVYEYGGGRGGGPIEAAVTSAEADDDTLRLRYEVYTGYSGLDQEQDAYFYKISGTLTLRDENGAYRFWSVDDVAEAEAQEK